MFSKAILNFLHMLILELMHLNLVFCIPFIGKMFSHITLSYCDNEPLESLSTAILKFYPAD